MEKKLYKLPEGWEWQSLCKVATVQSGTAFPKKYQGITTEAIPFLKVGDMNIPGNESKIVSWNNSISRTTAIEIKAKVMQAETVIFPKIGGAIATNKKRVLTRPSAYDNNVMGIFAQNESLRADFLYWYLQGIDLRDWATSAALPSMKLSTVKEYKIPLPPIEEQKRIVTKLNGLFTRIDTAITHLQDNLKLTKDLFASVLDAVFVPSGNIDQPPNGWSCENLQEVSMLITDGTHHSPKEQFDSPQEDLYKYITSKNIKFDGLTIDNISYIQKEIHDPIYARCNPEYLDQLITKDGAMTGTCCLNTLDEPFSLLSSVALVKLKREVISPYFLNYFLKSPTGQALMLGDISGAAITRTNLKKLKALKVPLPPMKEQQKIILHLDRFSKHIRATETATEEKLRNLQALKSSLLDNAFRGQL